MNTIIVSLENYSVGSYCACILLILSGPVDDRGTFRSLRLSPEVSLLTMKQDVKLLIVFNFILSIW